MLESIFIYCLLTAIMVLCGVVASQKERLYCRGPLNCRNRNSYKLSFLHWEIFLPLFAFAFIFGCRYNVGVDYPSYLDNYLHGTDDRIELLFAWVTNSMSYLGFHYSFYFALWAFIQVFLLFYTFRYQRFLFPYIAFFLIFGSYYLSMMNIIRQQLAACIFIYSIQYIDNKKFFRYLFCVFVASLFHRSALILILVYPLLRWRKDWFPNMKVQILLYMVAIYLSTNYDLVVNLVSGAFSFFTGFFGYTTYLVGILKNEQLNSMAQFGNNTGYGIFINIFISLTIILYSNKLKNYYNSSLFLMIYSLWFIRILADFCIGDSIILNRPFVYVTNFKIIMSAYFVCYCIGNKRVMSQLLAVAFILIHIALFLNIQSNGEVNTAMFKFFWQQ